MQRSQTVHPCQNSEPRDDACSYSNQPKKGRKLLLLQCTCTVLRDQPFARNTPRRVCCLLLLSFIVVASSTGRYPGYSIRTLTAAGGCLSFRTTPCLFTRTGMWGFAACERVAVYIQYTVTSKLLRSQRYRVQEFRLRTPPPPPPLSSSQPSSQS